VAANPANFSGHQFSLFEPPSVTAPQRNYDPASWAEQPDVSWHSSNQPTMPEESDNQGSYGTGFHVGTRKSAEDRGAGEQKIRPFVHPVRHSGSMAVRDEESEDFEAPMKFDQLGETSKPDPRAVFSDVDTNYNGDELMTNRSDEFPGRPQLTVPYINAAEDQGSISYRAPRENIRTWGEDVAADPGASRHQKLVAEQYDLTDPVGAHLEQTRTNRQNARATYGGIHATQGTIPGVPTTEKEPVTALAPPVKGLEMRKRHSWDER